MKHSKHNAMMMAATLVAALAVSGVVASEVLTGGKATLVNATPTTKTFTFCGGTGIMDKGTPFTLYPNKGEFHGNMMTATTCTAVTDGLQLGKQRESTPGYYDEFIVWDAPSVGAVANFFVSANNITGITIVGQDSTYVDGSHNTLTCMSYPNSMSFTEGAAVTYAALEPTLGEGTTRSFTRSDATVSISGLSNVKTVVLTVTAKQTVNAAHLKTFTVNWAC